MKLVRSDRFQSELATILKFIAKDNPDASKRFKNDLRVIIEDLQNMPYKYRQSIKSYDENVRDLIFKGYVIPYRVNGNSIEIPGIFNENEWS